MYSQYHNITYKSYHNIIYKHIIIYKSHHDLEVYSVSTTLVASWVPVFNYEVEIR